MHPLTTYKKHLKKQRNLAALHTARILENPIFIHRKTHVLVRHPNSHIVTREDKGFILGAHSGLDLTRSDAVRARSFISAPHVKETLLGIFASTPETSLINDAQSQT